MAHTRIFQVLMRENGIKWNAMNKFNRFRLDKPLIRLYVLFFAFIGMIHFISPQLFNNISNLRTKIERKYIANEMENNLIEPETTSEIDPKTTPEDVTDDDPVVFDATNGAVVFLFEDGWNTTYDVALPILTSQKFTGSLSLSGWLIGEAPFMTLDQVNELETLGWDLISNLKSYKNENIEELYSNEVMERKWLSNLDLTDKINVVTILDRELNQNDFTVSKLAGYQFILGEKALWKLSDATIKLSDFQLLDVASISSTSEYRKKLQEIKEDQSIIIIKIRRIEDNNNKDGMSITIGEFKEIVEIVSDLDLEVLGLSDYINYLESKLNHANKDHR